MISREDLQWLAGWLEGEGSFIKGPPSAPNKIYITAVSTDFDVMTRVAKLFGECSSYSRKPSLYARKPRKPHHRPYWQLIFRGISAWKLMLELYPLMGERRKGQIDRAAEGYIPRGRPERRHGTLNMYHAGCRCPECKEVKHQEYVERREKKKSG